MAAFGGNGVAAFSSFSYFEFSVRPRDASVAHVVTVCHPFGGVQSPGPHQGEQNAIKSNVISARPSLILRVLVTRHDDEFPD